MAKNFVRVLVLDDEDYRANAYRKRFEESDVESFNFIHVKHAAECIKQLENTQFDFVFLDHDLDGRTYVPVHEPNTGSEVARWIKANNITEKYPEQMFVLHSFNDDARNHMAELIGKCFNLSGAWMEDTFSKHFIFK